mgnify:CR=1 FL=1
MKWNKERERFSFAYELHGRRNGYKATVSYNSLCNYYYFLIHCMSRNMTELLELWRAFRFCRDCTLMTRLCLLLVRIKLEWDGFSRKNLCGILALLLQIEAILIVIEKLQNPQTASQAFDTLMHVYGEQVYWHIRKMVSVHDDANDILQNTFIKAWKNILKYIRSYNQKNEIYATKMQNFVV